MVEKGKASGKEKISEPSILIRPINRLGGLDNIHVALLALVAILVVLLLLVSYYKPLSAGTGNQTTTVAGPGNGTNYSTVRNASEIRAIAEQLLASYASTNSSLSLLPYYANVSAMTVSYIPSARQWYVQLPSQSPGGNSTFYVSALISDANGSVVHPFIQLASPPAMLKNQVVTPGVVQLYGKPYCTIQSPLSLYWFIDPYAPGAVQSLKNVTAMEKAYGQKLNISIKILYGSSFQAISNQVGPQDAQALGRYILCSSGQPAFPQFVSVLNSVFVGDYVSPGTLQSISTSAGINQTELNSCMSNVSGAINAQALLGQYYNITATPSVIVNCEYASIPQTVTKAVCYANSTICS